LFDVEPGVLIEAPEEPQRPGFEFGGWFVDFERTISWDFETDLMPNQSFVLYAKWLFQIATINYILNGGNIVPESYPTTYAPGESIVLPLAAKTGYLFRGWFLYPQDITQYPNTFGTKPGDGGVVRLGADSFGDLDFYAHFHPIQVNITLIPNHPLGSSVIPLPSQIRLSYGDTIIFGGNFPQDYGLVSGYVFIGWNTRRNGTGTWFNDGIVVIRQNNFDLFGQWQPVTT
jgi:uncharacterized repeat protein (TIGR02543 family)